MASSRSYAIVFGSRKSPTRAAVVTPPVVLSTPHDSVSPQARSPRDTSPTTPPITAEEEQALQKSNGYVSSPLRVAQRLASLDNSPLPNSPSRAEQAAESAQTVNGTSSKPPSVRFGPAVSTGSFPFDASPGATGPAPTTQLLQFNGTGESSPVALSYQRTNHSGNATPPGRRSVQFARSAEEEPSPLQTTTTWETDNEDNAEAPQALRKQRQASFIGKLKALASPASGSGHFRGQSGSTGFMTPQAALSPQSERSEPSYPVELTEAAEEGDGEESDEAEDGVDDLRPRKRRKSRRPVPNGSSSAPSTPRHSRFASFMGDYRMPGSIRPAGIRRNTVSDVDEHERHQVGVSEDEGRDRVRAAWRRGLDGARGLSYSARKHFHEPETPVAESSRRPSGMRRFTGFADGNSSPFRMRADRQASSTARKWMQVKAQLKTIGRRRQDERLRVDHQKSAQLMAELLAGAPAALVFASMFQRDEHGHRKVPIMLEQLKLTIPHSELKADDKGDRHLIFRLELEYGNGPTRMQWVIRRTLQDFVKLHLKYKGQATAEKFRHLRGEDKTKAKMPRFPKSAFPIARGARGLFDKLEDEDDEDPEPNTAGIPEPMQPLRLDGATNGSIATAGEASASERPGRTHKRRKSSFAHGLRRSSTGGDTAGANTDPKRLENYQDRQRKKLEAYLQQMVRWLIFRPDSTRLCKFLEVSALAIRLSAEGGYQGKQALLTIASRQHREIRRKGFMLDIAKEAAGGGFKDRHKRRWFLVRHSYVVCVDGPESTVPYDVFLVDSEFRTEKHKKGISEQGSAKDVAKAVGSTAKNPKAHLIRLYNAERKLKLIATNERSYLQFQESLNKMAEATIWSKKHRFGSFAPVRQNVWTRWLVDGRDHMWQVSRAIDNARDFVYIHDWWLSPELYLRRPAAISQKWRLDRLLQRKAQEGVKIFVIVYRNIESAIPIDSEHTKLQLLDLHPNICIQRSPNQFRQNQFFWAHHEKLVVVDNMMAFVGGVDLCFGRWDDPCHSLTDDKFTGFEPNFEGPRDTHHCQVWPGKDYSNPRVQDFYALDRPYEEMYDRAKVPRMPWHDISMQIVGQPARDVGRHFVQRWNYILRSRVPTRPTPVLIPPPEFDQAELDRLGLSGTCQIQICRSACNWSIGTPNKTEHSIMNAYCHLIRNSEHFVYIENQFYISSTTVEGTRIHNSIGDALVERAIRAAQNQEKWQACLVIPLMPGFQNSVDSQDGTSVRLIMQCQFRSICRGEGSIFARLRAKGIEPEDYIRFYSLRQWGKIGPRKCLTTEQLYIHAKTMVVDDRTVIIGSANINERSMLGSRDSEVAAVVTDTKMLPSFMAGKPYEVGEFAHTFRKRLMREHLGVDVDAIYRREQQHNEREWAAQDQEMARIYRTDFDDEQHDRADYFAMPPQTPAPLTERNLFANGNMGEQQRSTNDAVPTNGWSGPTQAATPDDSSSSGPGASRPKEDEKLKNETKKERDMDLDVDGYGYDNMRAIEAAGVVGLTDSYVDAQGHEVMLDQDAPDVKRLRSQEEQLRKRRSQSSEQKLNLPTRPPWPMERLDTIQLGLPVRSQLPELPAQDDTDIGGPPLVRGLSQTGAKAVNPMISSMRRPVVHEDCMTDPLSLNFYYDIWHKVAENNTKLYRQVFRCMPDSEVRDWATYERYNDYNEAFMASQGLGGSKPKRPKEAPGRSGPPGVASDAASVVTEKGAIRPRSKSVLDNMAAIFRPGSRTSEQTAHAEEAGEKDKLAGRPGSLGSAVSSDPTAVAPSGDTPPLLDEKEAAKQADGPGDENPKPMTAAAARESLTSPTDATSASVARTRTIQYTDSTHHAPETTTTATA
ncbi:Phospholipase D Active site motifs, partial [Teratosphaeria destructans]